MDGFPIYHIIERAGDLQRQVFGSERMTHAGAMRLNPRQWAYMGDTVFDLYVRTRILTSTDYTLPTMHKLSTRIVNSRMQAYAADAVDQFLSQDEREILRRARGQRVRASKAHGDPGEYAKATALEGLIGFLYLTGQDARLEEIMAEILRLIYEHEELKSYNGKR